MREAAVNRWNASKESMSKETESIMAILISNEIDLLRKLEMLKVELELIPNSSNLQVFKELDIDKDN